jgi:hypothetical protein
MRKREKIVPDWLKPQTLDRLRRSHAQAVYYLGFSTSGYNTVLYIYDMYGCAACHRTLGEVSAP